MMDVGKHGSRAALYARVSSDQQAQAQTITSQVEALQERIARDGLAVEPELCYLDDGYSGATLVRPALERLRDMAWAGAIDRLYVHSPDRLARNYAYQVVVVEELQRCGVELVFLNHQLGRSPEEDLLLQVQGVFAEYERTKIMERARRGKLHGARRGSVSVLSGAPYGYRYLSAEAAGGAAQYQVVLEQAAVVRQVFAWVAHERCSINEVCRRLKRQGVPSPTGRPSWNRSMIAAMLNNPAYKGAAAFGRRRVCPRLPRLRPPRGSGPQPRHDRSVCRAERDQWIEIPVPGIVSEGEFEAVGEQLAENRRRHRRHAAGARYLLQGLLVCKQCGYAYSSRTSISRGKSRAYYGCTRARGDALGEGKRCENRTIRTERLEAAVWEDVCLLLRDPDRVEQEYRRRSNRQRDLGWDEGEQRDRLLGAVKRGIGRLVDAYADGLLEREEFEPRLRRARERLARLEQEQQAHAEKASREADLRVALGCLAEFSKQVRESLASADWSLRREVIRALVKEVKVDLEEVQIVYRVSPSPFDPAPGRGRLQDCPKRFAQVSPNQAEYHGC